MMTSIVAKQASETVTRRLAVHDEVVAHVVGDPEGLHFCFLPGGHLHALRFGEELLVNLLLGCPLAGALQRLYVELQRPGSTQVVAVIGPESAGRFRADRSSAEWLVEEGDVTVRAGLGVDSANRRWRLKVSIAHDDDNALQARVLHGIDVGLASLGAALNNDA